jgi:hypothetical protein
MDACKQRLEISASQDSYYASPIIAGIAEGWSPLGCVLVREEPAEELILEPKSEEKKSGRR